MPHSMTGGTFRSSAMQLLVHAKKKNERWFPGQEGVTAVQMDQVTAIKVAAAAASVGVCLYITGATSLAPGVITLSSTRGSPKGDSLVLTQG